MIGGATTKLGVVLVVVGALLMAGPVFGFSTLAADRGVNVETAEDQNALLGIEDNSGSPEAAVTPPDREGNVFYLNDNADHFSAQDISATVLPFNDTSTELTASVQIADNGNDYVVKVQCGNSDLKENRKLSVQLSAASTVSIELERTTTDPIEVHCRGDSGSDGPTADAGGPYTTYEGESIQLDGTDSTTSTGTIHEYTWEMIEGAGTLEHANSDEPTYVAPNTLSENSSATVELTVTDNKGNTDTDEATINLHEESYKSLTADFTYSRTGNGNSKNVALDGSPSLAPDGTIDTFDWVVDKPDGPTETYTGETVSKADAPSGSDVTLTVTTESGEMDSVTKVVE